MKKRVWFLLAAALLLLPLSALADVLITEVMASSGVYENGHAYDWAEIANTGAKTEDLSGWYFSDSGRDPLKWAFPAGTKLKPGECLTVFCTGDATLKPGSGDTFYAPFKISASGEKLYLSDPSGELRQKLEVPAQYGTVSWGLAGEEWGYFETATRGKPNGKTALAARTDAPALETPGGFYDGPVTVTASGPEGAVLRYTADGTVPSKDSKTFPKDGLSLKKTAVLRLKAFREGEVSSPAVCATYFIGTERYTPVVSLIGSPDDFFGKKGALVKGSGSVPNYDKDYEYPVNVEYFDGNGLCLLNQTGTFTVTGHSASGNAQKTIGLYARKAWGPETFRFNPFPDRDYTEYRSLLLRGANSDWHATRLRDIAATSLAEGEGLAYQDHVIIEVYLNGEYWGHYNLREKINKYFVAQWEGLDFDEADGIDLLERTGSEQFTQNGSGADWRELCDFCKHNDLNVPENLAWVEERLDIDNLFTHAAYQIILGNSDFTNVRMYRVPGGRWKYILFDVEACWHSLDKTPLEYYIKPVSGKIQGFRHEPLNALLAVPEMKARFLTRVADILYDHFQWPEVENHFDDAVEVLEVILPRHIARWKNMKLSDWRTNVGAAEYYARLRPKKVPELLKKAMKLTQAEVDQYFGEVLEILEITNVKPEK